MQHCLLVGAHFLGKSISANIYKYFCKYLSLGFRLTHILPVGLFHIKSLHIYICVNICLYFLKGSLKMEFWKSLSAYIFCQEAASLTQSCLFVLILVMNWLKGKSWGAKLI